MLGKTSEDAPKKTAYVLKKIDVDAGYSSLLNIDAGYNNSDVEPLNPFVSSEKENYNEVKANKSRAVLDEEAAGCGCTDLFKGSDIKNVPTSIIERDSGFVPEADAGFDLDAGMISEIDAAVEKTDVQLFDVEKTVYDAGITDIGVVISDAGVDSGFDVGIEPALEPIHPLVPIRNLVPITEECTINGLAKYFAANNYLILVEMYKDYGGPNKIKGNFAFSGRMQNGRFVDLFINAAKTTLDESKKIKLEQILLNMKDLPVPKKDIRCSFDEIILKF